MQWKMQGMWYWQVVDTVDGEGGKKSTLKLAGLCRLEVQKKHRSERDVEE